MWRLRPTVLLAATWAVFGVASVKRQLRAGRSRPVVRRPPSLPGSAGRGVEGVLTRLSATCLEGAMVRQAWMVAQGDPRDVVIGVPPTGLANGPAHAWVDGLDTRSPQRFLELHRIQPPVSEPD